MKKILVAVLALAAALATPASADVVGVTSLVVGGGGGGITGLTVGTTPITSGTDGRVLYDNSGVAGELAVPLASSVGGTGNGFVKFTGPTTSEKTFTLPNANASLARIDAGQTFTGGTDLFQIGSAGANYRCEFADSGTATALLCYSAGGIVTRTSYQGFVASSTMKIGFTPSDATAALDAYFTRSGVGIVGVTNWLAPAGGALTAATMAAEVPAENRTVTSSYTWTNAQVAALAGTAGDIKVATLPAKTVVRDARVIITGAATGPTTVTVACGTVSAAYIDLIVASDAKAAANTVYGAVSGDRGTNLTGYFLPSYTATTDVNCHFISTGANLSTVTGSTGRVVLDTALSP